MTEIRSYHDKIAELKEYLVLNRNDEEGDSWIFGHNPTIENHLSSLNENEINELIDEIFTWEELERHHIADPISDTKNKFIDAQYVYGKIFLSIKDFEKLEYLIQNLAIVVWESSNKRPINFYTDILTKVETLNEQLNFGYNHLIRLLKGKIENEKAHNKP